MSEKLFYTGIDLQQNQLLNAVIHPSSTAPSNPVEGQLYFDTDTHKLMSYSGTAWEAVCADALSVAAGSTDYLAIVNGEISIKALAITNVTVDATETSIADFVTANYTVGNEFQEGDVVILTAAADGVNRYIHNGGTAGTSADFTVLDNVLSSSEVRGYLSASDGVSYNSGTGEITLTDGGVSTAKLANDSVTKDKINADVAGAGLAQNVDGSLEAKVDNASIKIVNDTMTVDCDVVANQLAGAGLAFNETQCKLDVNADDSTLEVVSDTVQVKDGGITQAKLADALEAKIVNAFKALVGNGSATSFNINHGLNTEDIFCHAWKVSSGEHVECQIVIVDANNITVGAFPAPTTNNLKILIQKAILE